MNLKETARDTMEGTTLIWVLLFGSLLYAGLILWSGAGKFLQLITQIRWTTLGIVILLVILGYLLRFVRWHYYLEVLGYDVPLLANLRIYLASFLMAISPGKVGEAMKSYFLKKEFSVPATPTVAGFFCERFTDVLATVLLSGAGFLVYPHGGWVILAIALGQGVVLIVLQRRSWAELLFFGPLERWTPLDRWIEKLREFYDISGKLLSLQHILVGTGLGILSWGLEGLCLYLIVVDFAGEAMIHPAVAVFIFCASVLLGAASMLPGGIGGSEAIMIAMLMFFGAQRSLAVSTTVLVRFTTLWFGVIIGAICWGLSLQKIHVE
ncbi:MAG: YbhN family protein [bacterium]